jgi:hypothetical protein
MILRQSSLAPTTTEEQVRTASLKAAFAAKYDVKPFRFTARNIARIFRSGEALQNHSRPLAEWIAMSGGGCGSCPPFDHGEVWGKDGRPTILVGHPCELDHDSEIMVRTIKRFGLEVRTEGESYYGFGTRQVLVFARPVIEERCRPRLFVPKPAFWPQPLAMA